MTLQNVFLAIASKFSDDEKLKNTLWNELEKQYSSPKRHYHNLMHLENMITELDAVKKQIANYDVILFSVFYHDVVYDATAGDNEEKSAEFARKRLSMLNAGKDFSNAVARQIVATKKHEKNNDADTNFLLDADLSVLGKDWGTYRQYATQIREEYAIYPDILYKPGRKKVLQHFLTFETIYKTDEFKQKYEQQARRNLAAEAESL
jgi:predicted metal-dependent HD superfamily phosphohydrolase